MIRGAMVIAVMLALVAPATASAAKPAVRTGGVENVTPSSATLNARIDANGKATTYFFQIGTTRIYGVTTPETAAGAGANPVRVSVPVSGLAPNTTYHYRVVARNPDGQTIGGDRAFKTRVQPLGVSLVATPSTVAPGGSTVLSGQLTGTNNANRQVVLQASAFPYTTGFTNVGNVVLTDAAGNFSFNGLPVNVTTQFRVQMPNKPEVVSPIVIVGASMQVLNTYMRKVERHRNSVSVRFSGYFAPPAVGARVNIQKLRNGVWTTIAHTRAKHKSDERSSFKTRVRVYRSGQFRVLVEPTRPELVPGAGRTIDVKVRR